MRNTNTNPARGMRDFLPPDVRKRDYVIGVIKEVYEKYGYEPLETPSIENLETLTNKYGEEGDQLMFKVLKRGEKLTRELEEGRISGENQLSDLALRYDLTVPLARVVANYWNELPKFFKRYQIQPVWRADRPARGRFREFYQCDVDAIGSTSMIIEAEQCSAVSEIFDRLGFKDFEIRINHRNLLAGMLEVAGIPKKREAEVLVALDKLDKAGKDVVEKELRARGVTGDSAANLFGLIEGGEESGVMMDGLRERLSGSETGLEGVSRLEELVALTAGNAKIRVDPTLARGLSYYTGTIFEVSVPDLAGSLGGGGRYDGLIAMFGKEEVPACGFSLGLERILVVMEERGMFPGNVLSKASAKVMVTVWNEKTARESLKLADELRSAGLKVLVYPQPDKLGKQFKYADQIGVDFVCTIGDSEIADDSVSVKDMRTGDQEKIPRMQVAGMIIG